MKTLNSSQKKLFFRNCFVLTSKKRFTSDRKTSQSFCFQESTPHSYKETVRKLSEAVSLSCILHTLSTKYKIPPHIRKYSFHDTDSQEIHQVFFPDSCQDIHRTSFQFQDIYCKTPANRNPHSHDNCIL